MTAAAPAQVRSGRRGFRGRPWWALGTVAAGAMMVSLDTTIVALAQPTMQARLHASIGAVQWVTAGYLLPLAALLIVAGKLGDRFGHRLVFLVGTAGFAASSLAIGLSTHIGWVIAFRVTQGVFGALMQPPTLALLRVVFPADRLGLPIALRTALLGIATAAGPVVGGLLIERFGWQSVFYLNLPVGVAVVVAGLLVLREARPGAAATTSDPVAVLLLSAALLTLLWGVVTAPEHGWRDPTTWLTVGGGLVLGVAFCLWERRTPGPLVPMSLFRSPAFAAGVLLMSLVSFSMFGIPFVLGFFLQNTVGLSVRECGFLVLWLTVAMVVAGTATGVGIRWTGSRLPALVGIALAAGATFGLSRVVDGSVPGSGFRLWLVLLGMGFSAVIVSATHLIVGGAPVRHAGVASGVQQTSMQVGGSLGTAVLGMIVAARVEGVLPGRLAEAGVPSGDVVGSVSTGRLPPGRAGEIGRAVFIDSVQSTLVVAAGLAAVGLAVASILLLRQDDRNARRTLG
jgi:EmrB/QacA subfamily drug resistance transporter